MDGCENEETHTLMKTNENKRQLWEATLSGNNPTKLVWTWGHENGNRQTRTRIYDNGKVNRTPREQARLECQKMIKDKIRKGYVLSPTETSSLTPIRGGSIESDEISVPHVMLAHPLEKYPAMYDSPDKGAHVMPKLDGIYAMAHLPTGKLWSRQRVPIVGLPHIENAVRSLTPRQTSNSSDVTWIVGELYKHGMGFQKITGLVRSSKHTAEEEEIRFHVFDVIDGDNSFGERYRYLRELIPESARGPGVCDNIKLVEAVHTNSLRSDYARMHEDYTDMGYEGVMIHPDNGPGYQQNKRTKWLLKYKTFRQDEYECLQVLPLKHASKSGEPSAGSVLLVDETGNRFCATPKFSDEEKKKLWASRDDYVGRIATVKYFCKTDHKKLPRFPILIGFRHSDDM